MKINFGKNKPSKKENVSEGKTNYRLSFSLGNEFRGLINEILSLNAVVLKGVEDPTLKRYANKVQNASRGLLSVVGDVMDFSKIESGEMELAPVTYDLFLMLNECYEMFFQRAQDKNLKFIFDIDSNVPTELFGDEKRIRQILLNLIFYSLKYTVQGEVALKVTFNRDSESSPDIINLVLTVRDTGEGIPKFAMDTLFQISDRIESGRDVEGVDLCLNLTQRIVELFGGSLDVKSDVGRGTSFVISIPQLVKKETPMGDFEERRKKHSRSMESVLNKFKAPNSEILVADGLPMNLRVVKSLLKDSEIKVDTADNGMEALEKTKRKHYDVIFLEQELPVLSGNEVMEMIKTLSGNPNSETPVVLLLSDDQILVNEVYEKMGFTTCLQKPFREEQLFVLLAELLSPDFEVSVEETPSEDENPIEVVRPQQVLAAPASKAVVENTSENNAKEILDIVRESKIPSDLLKLAATRFVDVHVGLNFCQNDEDLYRSQLIDFRKLNRAESLESAMDNEDFELYRIEARSLKSAALAIGAIDIASKAKAMEYACREGRYDFVQMSHDNFILEYKNLMNVLGEMI